MFNLLKPFYPLVLTAAKSNPEGAHLQLLNTLNTLERTHHTRGGNWLLSQLDQSFCVDDSRLKQTLWGLTFNNPVGLAAGCDKEGIAAGIWSHLGFGFAELGAVTLHPQPGNPRPRLFRLPHDKAVLNRLGANNQGAEIMAQTLAEIWQRSPRNIPIGINLCKSKITPLDEAAQDYVGSFSYLENQADYFVVNVSSPNTPGLRSLQEGEQLNSILQALQAANQHQKPLFVKISPDLEEEAILTIIELAQTHCLAGIIATNTTIKRDRLTTQILPETGNKIQEEAGGISGLPIRDRSTEIIGFIYQKTQGKLPIIGVGGIFTPDDAWNKIIAGASLLQLYTGWIYQGPWIIPDIVRGLGDKLKQLGLSHISQAVGINHK
ncbi:Dihydroorotate oxidase [Rippkaea orientalis PCC 8801]|uniref:Dihydroorotate dehydrogenase (quinone) n=1 Tax=Rippkaea orientalis (strain PCC 8801 / RF-1) TaxID=41431 RepID=PYRD_RIPO1|nr:quinone-dependent dihydroorotate dehydrogenase [Rippkaea orientalis]B7JXU8.1 RecName: Full=Dihydroorotate dehydrogenase (quinone); AltName: Full=DHOdehase; Short=DHOD; Short=DHODase; AltName: Full=Dihydroorotate oxidase [Rippkaea orientalis PCC 8801]ACK65912.1 Dihydroorotate oxidase [Rippkaea orientalis PCC 8801]